MPADVFITIINNPVLRRHLDRVARQVGITFTHEASLSSMHGDDSPNMIVFELEREGVVQEIKDWKSRWPGCFLAASVTELDRERWIGAEAAGCDLVANRGALPRLLRKKLEALRDGESLVPEKMRLVVKPVLNPGDGLVGRLPDNPEDPIVVFRSGEEYFAIRDVCPHAGYSLADGDFDSETRVITCSEHGSRFNVETGERVRGPADYPIRTYPVFLDEDDIYVEVEANR